MNKINLTELKADRERGAYAYPWNVRTLDNFGYNIVHYVDGDRFDIARIGKVSLERDAKRIARLPDLEAAYITAVEALQHIIGHSDSLATAVFAREILEKISHAD